jgi:hypothetical protein
MSFNQFTGTTAPYGMPIPAGEDIAPSSDQDPQGNFWGYLLEEDSALRFKLNNLTAIDKNSRSRKVQTFFNFPPKETVKRSYPYITISFAGEEKDSEREHRGWVGYSYMYLQDVALGQEVYTWYPIPMMLDYIVTLHTGDDAQMLKQLVGKMNGIDYLHPRDAYLLCSGGTIRRIVRVSSTASSGTDEQGVRAFRQTYRIRIPTEIEPNLSNLSNSRISDLVIALQNENTGTTTDITIPNT